MNRMSNLRLAAWCLSIALLWLPSTAGARQVTPSGGLVQADLEELLGPIALYPDELLANVLAASLYPAEIAAANEYVSRGGDPEKIADQDWEDPVQAIAMIPDLIAFLAENLDWITAVGQAYIVQSTDVMKAVQALRAKAMDNGALQSGEQMTVVREGATIIIQPTNPEIIYVPVYNPRVVYVAPRPGSVVVAGAIGFGVGVLVGASFHSHYHCHWHGGYIGWGWGRPTPYYGGRTKVNIDNSVNIKTGDININSGNKIQGGDRTNIKGGDRNTNNIGREGTKWQPNDKKVNTMDIQKPGGADKLNGFKGVAGNASAQTRVPDRTVANTGRQSPAAATRDLKPANSPAAPSAKPNIPATPKAKPSIPTTAAPPAPSTGRPAHAPSNPSARPTNTSASPKTRETPVIKSPAERTPTPRPASPAAKSAPAQSRPGGFSPDRDNPAVRSTGAAKRGNAAGAGSGAKGGNAGSGRTGARG